MINEIILAIIQAATEFLPVSSDGHLALASIILGEPNLLFITFLHLASLLAVIIFTRKEILNILRFEKESWKILGFVILGIIPAVVVGLLFNDYIEKSMTSLALIGFFFAFTGLILVLTKFAKKSNKELNKKNVFLIGLMQALALFPAISRSGMTISTGMFFGIEREKLVKFSFLMFIPLAIGAFGLEFIKNPDPILKIPALTLTISFGICFLLSLLFLNVLNYIIKTDKFWMFGIYCFFMSGLSFAIYFLV